MLADQELSAACGASVAFDPAYTQLTGVTPGLHPILPVASRPNGCVESDVPVNNQDGWR
jgi:hypothetical protein